MREMEEMRNFNITLVSAEYLPDIRRSGRMKVYAKVSMNGVEAVSDTDKAGETNPRWNCLFQYTIKDSYVTRDVGLLLVVKLYCARTIRDNKYIGQVNLPVKGLFDNGLTCAKTLTFDVCGTSSGKLNIRYSFGDVFLAKKRTPFNWKRALANGGLMAVGKVIVGGVLASAGLDFLIN